MDNAIANRLKATLGLDGAVSAADDGIVVRLPDTDDAPPGPEVFVIDPDEIEAMVTDALGDSPLFAARFRECAARAFAAAPSRSGQTIPAVAAARQRSAATRRRDALPRLPIVLEAVRECLQDVRPPPYRTCWPVSPGGRCA